MAPAHELRSPDDLHKVRDGAAFAELAIALTGFGYDYGDLLFQYPLGLRKSKGSPTIDQASMVLVSTRPPLSDLRGNLLRSHTRLEEEVFAILRAHFLQICSRRSVRLTQEAGRRLDEQSWTRRIGTESPVGIGTKSSRNRANFRVNAGSWVEEYVGSREKPKPRTTLAYLFVAPKVRDEVPALLVAFGMGGRETLLWARALRTTHLELLRRAVGSTTPRFTVAEFQVPRGTRPANLSAVKNFVVDTAEVVL